MHLTLLATPQQLTLLAMHTQCIDTYVLPCMGVCSGPWHEQDEYQRQLVMSCMLERRLSSLLGQRSIFWSTPGRVGNSLAISIMQWEQQEQ